MANGSGENFLSVLAGAAGGAAQQVGAEFQGAKQRERQNNLQQLMGLLQVQEAERAQAAHGQRMTAGRFAQAKAAREAKEAARRGLMTVQERAIEDGNAQAAQIQARLTSLEPFISTFGQGFYPDIPGFARLDPNEALRGNLLGAQAIKTEADTRLTEANVGVAGAREELIGTQVESTIAGTDFTTAKTDAQVLANEIAGLPPFARGQARGLESAGAFTSALGAIDVANLPSELQFPDISIGGISTKKPVTPKTLSAKEQAIKDGFEEDYSPPVAKQLMQEYSTGNNPQKRATAQYHKFVNEGKGITGQAKPEGKAMAAKDAGVGPRYVNPAGEFMTLQSVERSYDKKLKRGDIHKDQFNVAILEARHYYENLHANALTYFRGE